MSDATGWSAWQSAVAGVLAKAGRTFDDDAPERALERDTLDGVTIRPLYTSADLPEVVVAQRGAAGWAVCQVVAGPDATEVNTLALDELERGASALWVQMGGLDPQTLPAVLAGVRTDLAQVLLDPADRPDAVVSAAAEYVSALAGSQIHAGLDPFLDQTDFARIADVIKEAPEGLGVLVADARPVLEAGAGQAHQLGYLIACVIAILRELERHGVPPDQAAPRLLLRLAVTDDQFAGIAAIRALRLLWQQLQAGYGLQAPCPQIHAVTAEVMLTRQDPWVNLLRCTVAAFAAGVGGADLVTVSGFDARFGRPNALSRRAARNIQHLLLLESGVGAVQDPAAGSFAVEAQTNELAQAAWAFTQQLEHAGGVAAARDSGLLASVVGQVWQDRQRRLNTRRQPITGVTEFPILDQPVPERDPWPDAGRRRAPLPQVYYDDAAEALRESASRATVPVLQLGTVARASARVGFLTNLLAIAGARVNLLGPVAEESALAGVLGTGGGVLFLAGADRDYQQLGDAAVSAARAAGFTTVLVAGQEGAVPGADGAVGLGADVIDVLSRVPGLIGGRV